MKREAGILVHVSSLPSPFGIGDMGPSAYRFVDLISQRGQSLWQILPLNPTDQAHGNSPYFSISLFAGNPILISPELLYMDGLIDKNTLDSVKIEASQRVDYPRVYTFKGYVLSLAFDRFREDEEFERFCKANAFWLEDFARFKVLRDKTRRPWWEWKDNPTISDKELLKEKFVQYIFYKQWHSLKSYANGKGVKMVGDLPIYPAPDSSEVWANREIFRLRVDGLPSVVAGVPPDYFSKTGQLWGNPVYNWDVLEKRGFDWWLLRLKHALELFDLVRLDHFRGFSAFYCVPFGEKTAEKGWWEEGPGFKLFSKVRENFPHMPFIAEDLGIITEDVVSLRKGFGIPGMKVLAFAFYEKNSPHLPHNYEENCVVYTTTHDNMPLRDWFELELSQEQRERVISYLGYTPQKISHALIRLAYMSPVRYRIIAMQDILNLGKESRMNTPATVEGNWEWRMTHMPETLDFIGEMAQIYGIL
ncbi:MAG: 4-alpha-glucanotransferase [Acidobacteria bacterium]|nr:MAG: 4-alpha-glucanotransferase [Acidobacteriota bacterium]